MSDPATLGDLVLDAAERHPDHGISFIDDGSGAAAVDYGTLAEVTARIGAALIERCAPGARAVLVYPPGLDFVLAFLATTRAGIVPVPLYPPTTSVQAWVRWVELVVDDARPEVFLTTKEFLGALTIAGVDSASFGPEWLATDVLAADTYSRWHAPRVTGDDLALIQYTSGSTGRPKGVPLRHRNLLANERAIGVAFGMSADDVVVSWLPVYHDMGLIGCVLQPLFQGQDAHLLSPVAFLQRPSRWLEAISRAGGTVSGGPNFAYELCVKRAADVDPSVDLTSWRLAFTGAEKIRPDTIDRFAEAFGPYGFRREAIYPCYGLAEASLIVTGTEPGQGPRVVPFSRSGLSAGIARAPCSDSEPAQELVSLGSPVIGHEVTIADPRSCRPLGDGETGEIWVRGPSVAGRYWNRPAESEHAFGAKVAGQEAGPPWLRTGDLGFVVSGELFVTDRIKELMIIRGRNVHPADVEQAVQAADTRLRPGCGAAFSVAGELGDEVVVVQETSLRPGDEVENALRAIRRSVGERVGLSLEAVVLVPPRTVPKTSSGKLQRLRCRDLYLAGTLECLARWDRSMVSNAEVGADDAARA